MRLAYTTIIIQEWLVTVEVDYNPGKLYGTVKGSNPRVTSTGKALMT